ncbi:condensation domain-containing protein, partial [Undibacterium sp. TS12]|uniref:condensation domain-containing protein n=1 Tax=Undibacterium sp. TS12 TaxID=2908202 RepID=UPI001F4C7431
MNDILQLVADFQERGVSLRIEEGQLRYRAPQGALDAEDLQLLRTNKSALMTYLQSDIQSPQTTSKVPQIRALQKTAHAPLSFAQARLRFLEQLGQLGEVYHISGAVRLDGQLNIQALEQSLNELTNRHEVLRTSYKTVDGQDVQVLGPADQFRLTMVDLSELSNSEQDLQQVMQQEIRRPFDLGTGPMLRAAVFRISGQAHILVLTMHHIASDGWSIDLLVREMRVLYTSFTRGLPSPLLPLRLQYADYAAWQRQWLQGEILERQLSYWRKQLSGAPDALDLPTDHPRPAVATHRGAVYFFS